MSDASFPHCPKCKRVEYDCVCNNPEEIWLSPICEADTTEGRTWSPSKPGDCPDCELPPVRYIRADLVRR